MTVAYCRVSTEEQAAEGYSIDGQTAKLTAYADLHDLGDVTVIEDPGASGKNTNRPGLQRLIAMVEAGHVDHILLWRLDRLSRDLEDLIGLSKLFEQHGVSMHSVTESLDLSSPTGRMFFHILGSFAQFYREQLAENVKMGQAQARAQGRWTNRPPTGYDLGADGILVPNADAATVVRVFELRAQGVSQGDIEARTGVKHSTVVQMLRNRAYLGEIRHKNDWLPGIHRQIITQKLWDAAHKTRPPRRPSRPGPHVRPGSLRRLRQAHVDRPERQRPAPVQVQEPRRELRHGLTIEQGHRQSRRARARSTQRPRAAGRHPPTPGRAPAAGRSPAPPHARIGRCARSPTDRAGHAAAALLQGPHRRDPVRPRAGPHPPGDREPQR